MYLVAYEVGGVK